jgi:hypothetical protein
MSGAEAGRAGRESFIGRDSFDRGWEAWLKLLIIFWNALARKEPRSGVHIGLNFPQKTRLGFILDFCHVLKKPGGPGFCAQNSWRANPLGANPSRKQGVIDRSVHVCLLSFGFSEKSPKVQKSLCTAICPGIFWAWQSTSSHAEADISRHPSWRDN